MSEAFRSMELITYLFQNFILTDSIFKQHIIQFEKDINSEDFSKSNEYKQVKNYLLENEHYLILLGLRNYFQHLFGLHLGESNIGGLGKHLFIPSFAFLKFEKLKKTKENKALIELLKSNLAGLPIAGFAVECIKVINNFFERYDKFISSYFKKEIEADEDNLGNAKYAFDMHEIYCDNINKLNNS